MTKKEAIKAIDKAIELQHKHYQRFGRSIGNCIYLHSAEASIELKKLFCELFMPKNTYFFNWMALSLNPECVLTAKQIYEDRITALLFLKEYVKQHGVNV